MLVRKWLCVERWLMVAVVFITVGRPPNVLMETIV
jgi:hypothetical protein